MKIKTEINFTKGGKKQQKKKNTPVTCKKSTLSFKLKLYTMEFFFFGTVLILLVT